MFSIAHFLCDAICLYFINHTEHEFAVELIVFRFGIHTRQAIDHLNGDYTLMKVIANLWLIYGRLIFYIFCVFELRFSLSNFVFKKNVFVVAVVVVEITKCTHCL